jgi:SlyX protein
MNGTQMTNTTSRIDELEMRMAHQDQTIAELNDVITAQWKKIEVLERQLGQLRGEIENMDQRAAPIDRPPHY